MKNSTKTKEQLLKKINSLNEKIDDLEKYRSLYNNVPLSYQSLNEDGCFNDINTTWLQLLGYNRDEVIGKYFGDFLHPDWKVKFEKNFPEFKKRGYVHDIHFKIGHKDGRYFDIAFEGCIGYNPDGSFKRTYCVFKDVTKEMASEIALKESEQKYKAVVESARDMIVVIQNDVIIFANQHARKIYDGSLGKILGQPLVKFVHPDSLMMVKKRYDNWKKGKIVPNVFKLDLLDSKNKKVSCEVRSSTISYDGKPSELVIIHDITKRKQTEDALRKSENKYKSLVEKAGIAILMDDKKGNLTFFNKRFADLYGYTEQEITKKRIQILVHPDDVNKVMKLHNDRLAGKKVSSSYEFRGIKKDGSVINLETDVSILKKGGTAIGTRSYIWDITERKQAEGILNKSKANVTALLENTTDSIWAINTSYEILFTNTAFTSAFNASFGVQLEYGVNLLMALPEPMRALWKSRYDRALNKEQFSFIDKIDLENDYIYIEVFINPIIVEDKVIGASFFGRDITDRKLVKDEIEQKTKELEAHLKNSEKQRVATISVLSDLNSTTKILQSEISERKRTEDELKIYRDHLEVLVKDRTLSLEEANKELEAFAYSVSHDLRAPLRAIDGFTRILVEDHASKLDKDGKRLGKVVQNNAKKMGKLIDDLLAFSRMGRASLNPSNIDMKNMVNSMYHEVTSDKERKRIKLTIANLPDIEGDTTMMRQVWINLISNAVKFSSHRKKAIISVTSSEEKNKITYCIKDNGAGFNMKYVDKVFGVFQRLHSEKEFEGTGVGLALVKRIISRHDGNIWTEGKVNKGAEFYFALPRRVSRG